MSNPEVDSSKSTAGEHVSWTAEATAYLRNLDREDREQETFAVHYQPPPKKTDKGTSIGLRFPTLIVSGYCGQPQEIAERVARILNAHWEEPA
jgi:hypothetical protein